MGSAADDTTPKRAGERFLTGAPAGPTLDPAPSPS
jgi:hypothetical protein